MPTTRKLKLWNGRCYGGMERMHANIAAYTQKEAIELGQQAFSSFTRTELTQYWSNCWGNDMVGVTPTVPGVWITYGGNIWMLVSILGV